MKQFIKTYWKTLAFFAAAGLVGGFLTGIFLMDSYPDEIRQQLLDQKITDTALGLITALQAAGYGIVLGAIGIWLGKKTGLWKDERSITKKPLLVTMVIAVVGGLGIIVPDLVFFGHYNQTIMDSYCVKPSAPLLLGSVIYGGVIEEVMLRLFMMSLVAFILHKLFERKKRQPSTGVLIAANIVAALLFAAGHLPTTFLLIGSSGLIIFRCFLLNGCFGLLFGYLYRKYGLRYTMLAHGGCHVISKLIWILFV
jgi:membrane protease YdiL (CAAX protease family)